jgi:AraC family transcriptional regulator of adaptative response/methylated-DNA-[protein]-cysteine methyltransferase
VLDTAIDAGLSGPGRLHDLCVNLEAATPGEIKAGGEGWTIRSGFADSLFGICLVGESPRGICHLSFVDSKNRKENAAALRKDWPRAKVEWDANVAKLIATAITEPSDFEIPLRALVKGTDFQMRVWRALLQIPPGTLTTYGTIAESLGDRRAARAVGSAVGQNRLAYPIPCHRVIRETGVFGNYRWGPARKKAIVAWESRDQFPIEGNSR